MKNLILLREEKGMRQADIAEKIGMSRQAYWSYENDKREPDLNTLIKLADYFNTSVDYLLGRTEMKDVPLQWTSEEIAQGVGKHKTALSAEEWEVLELFEELKQKKGTAAVKAIQAMIRAYIDQ